MYVSKIQIESVIEMNFRIHGLYYIGYGSLIEVLTDNRNKFYEVINYFKKKPQEYNTSIFFLLASNLQSKKIQIEKNLKLYLVPVCCRFLIV